MSTKDERIKKIGAYTHTHTHTHTHTEIVFIYKNEEKLPFVTTQMDSEDISSEICQRTTNIV